MTLRNVHPILTAVTAILFLAPGALAQGYTEVNQEVIDSGSGFPYTISQPGVYRLTGDIVKPASAGNVAAVVIDASDVTLDLNDFQIEGPGICTRNASTGAVTCVGHVPGSGIQESGGHTNVRIRKGTVHGFFNNISMTAAAATVEDMTIYDAAFVGVSAIGDTSRVERVTAVRNGTTGIAIQNNSIVENCDASQNDDYGIIANLASTVRNSDALGNRLGGMSLNSQAIFTGNTVGDNFGPDPVFSGNDGGGNTCTNAVGTPVGC